MKPANHAENSPKPTAPDNGGRVSTELRYLRHAVPFVHYTKTPVLPSKL